MEKIDHKKQLGALYRPPTGRVVAVDVPVMNFLMVDGQGDPNTAQEYADALEALYAMSYTLKFAAKKGPAATDYVVMPLEGLWWADDMAAFTGADKSNWKWTAMIMQPDFITLEMVESARAEVLRKKNPASLPKVRFESFAEGPAAQIMHIGPYSAEAPNIRKVHDFIEEQGRGRRGKHHEIYLGDPRRTDPARLKTIIRQPMT